MLRLPPSALEQYALRKQASRSRVAFATWADGYAVDLIAGGPLPARVCADQCAGAEAGTKAPGDRREQGEPEQAPDEGGVVVLADHEAGDGAVVRAVGREMRR